MEACGPVPEQSTVQGYEERVLRQAQDKLEYARESDLTTSFKEYLY